MPTSTTKFVEENILQKIERTANAAVTKRRFVKANANHLQCNPSTANDASLGVALNDALATESVEIATAGIVMVDAGGAIAVNDEVVADANGKAVARGVTATVLYQVAGRALTAAANNEQVCIQLSRYGVWGANAS